jgi:hypothetical protein
MKEACWSIQERLVGGKGFRMRKGVGSERWGYWLGKDRFFPKRRKWEKKPRPLGK